MGSFTGVGTAPLRNFFCWIGFIENLNPIPFNRVPTVLNLGSPVISHNGLQ